MGIGREGGELVTPGARGRSGVIDQFEGGIPGRGLAKVSRCLEGCVTERLGSDLRVGSWDFLEDMGVPGQV